MGKFFRKEPRTCSICGLTKPIQKTVRNKDGKFYYCKDCWAKTYGVAKTMIYEQVLQAKKQGKSIGLKQLREVSDKIIKEL